MTRAEQIAAVLAMLERRKVITTDPNEAQECCGIPRDDDGFCVHRPGHPIYLAAQEGERGGAEVAAAVGTVDLSCELYDEPGQDCITAGPAILAADGCTGCRVRAALADPAGALAKHDAEVEERVLRAFADHDLHGLIPHSEIGNRWYHDGLRGAQDTAREWADYRADIEGQS